MKELKPVIDSPSEWDSIERILIDIFRRELYFPLLKIIGVKQPTLKNSKEDLLSAIQSGRINFNRGRFSGKFNASLSKELRSLGATWDRKTGTFKLPASSLPYDIRSAIGASYSSFQKKLKQIDELLTQKLPAEIAGKVNIESFVDTALYKTERSLQESMKAITVIPKLTKDQRSFIAKEWSNNMQLFIKDFTEEEIKSLRKNISKSLFAGNRYESAISSIKDSYGVSEKKAKFLARQETNLALAKFKSTRYAEAGVEYYKWGCVAGTKDHPVRPSHKALEGKVFKFSDPPITTPPGEPQRRCNPREDYNCRCFAIPIVGYKHREE